MAQFPALPLWTDAYLADTWHLTDAEHGLYLQLLILLWRSPGCKIPNDDEWIERRFPGRLPAVRKIVSEFCGCDGNWITQKKLASEFQYLVQRRKRQSDRAKARWDKEKGSCRGNAASGNALSTPTPTPTPISKKESSLAQMSESESESEREGDWPKDFREQFWQAYPRKVGKKAAIRKLELVRKNDHVPWVSMLTAIGRINASEPRYIPHPTTWLNQGRWDDEAPRSTNGLDRPPTQRERMANALQRLGSGNIRKDLNFGLPKLDHK